MIQILFAWGYGFVLYMLSWYSTQPAWSIVGYILSAWMFISGGIAAWNKAREDD